MHIINSIKSPNFDIIEGGLCPKFIILHYTDTDFQTAMNAYLDQDSKLSAHYLIKSNGEIYNLVEDSNRAWHAGVSYWNGIEKLNDHSIGIEIDNLANKDFTQEQMESCVNLCKYLSNKHNIHRNNILGHSDISPGRKADPGRLFNWKLLEDHELGIKSSEVQPLVNLIKNHMNDEITNIQMLLKNLGYKIEITNLKDRNTIDVINAFLAHFAQEIDPISY